MDISPFYDKKIDCINCKEKFTSTKIRSRFIRIAEHESDFRTLYKQPEINPIYYTVTVCPHCGFSFTDEFSPYFAPSTKDIIHEQITAKWTGRSFGNIRTPDEAIETYKLAFLSASLKKENALTKAGLVLRIAWLYREINNAEHEQRFLTIARDLYTESYSEGDYKGTQMSETRVLYLMAELSWRIGDREEAVRSFSRVIEGQRLSNEPHIIQMAKERWQDIRELT